MASVHPRPRNLMACPRSLENSWDSLVIPFPRLPPTAYGRPHLLTRWWMDDIGVRVSRPSWMSNCRRHRLSTMHTLYPRADRCRAVAHPQYPSPPVTGIPLKRGQIGSKHSRSLGASVLGDPTNASGCGIICWCMQGTGKACNIRILLRCTSANFKPYFADRIS